MAGPPARVGARAGRLSRFLRLIRIAKLIKVGAKRSNSVTAEREALNEMKPTVIGGLFTEITTRKVVLIILAVLITSSFISVDDFDGNRFTGIVFVENYTLSPPAFIATSAFRIEYMGIVHTNSNTLAVYVPVTQMALNDLRDNEILKITGSCSVRSLHRPLFRFCPECVPMTWSPPLQNGAGKSTHLLSSSVSRFLHRPFKTCTHTHTHTHTHTVRQSRHRHLLIGVVQHSIDKEGRGEREPHSHECRARHPRHEHVRIRSRQPHVHSQADT